MSLHTQSIALYRARLDIMTGLLTKAEHHPKGDALLGAKLADDMHPLATQVRFVGNLPGEALSRLTSRSFTSREDDATSLAEAKAHISETAALLDSIGEDDLVAPDHSLVVEIPNGIQFTMRADEYVRDWSLPNFYFHLTTAYAILRAEGLEIGKADFMPHMMRYVTKGPDQA